MKLPKHTYRSHNQFHHSRTQLSVTRIVLVAARPCVVFFVRVPDYHRDPASTMNGTGGQSQKFPSLHIDRLDLGVLLSGIVLVLSTLLLEIGDLLLAVL
jgi:hypothetical protein